MSSFFFCNEKKKKNFYGSWITNEIVGNRETPMDSGDEIVKSEDLDGFGGTGAAKVKKAKTSHPDAKPLSPLHSVNESFLLDGGSFNGAISDETAKDDEEAF